MRNSVAAGSYEPEIPFTLLMLFIIAPNLLSAERVLRKYQHR